MVRSKRQMWIDIAILIAIVVAIYYLKIQTGDADTYGPIEGLQAFWNLGG